MTTFVLIVGLIGVLLGGLWLLQGLGLVQVRPILCFASSRRDSRHSRDPIFPQTSRAPVVTHITIARATTVPTAWHEELTKMAKNTICLMNR